MPVLPESSHMKSDCAVWQAVACSELAVQQCRDPHGGQLRAQPSLIVRLQDRYPAIGLSMECIIGCASVVRIYCVVRLVRLSVDPAVEKPAKATSVRFLTVMLQGIRCTCSWRHPKKSSVGIGSRLRRIGTRNRSFSKMGSAVIDRLITDRRGLGGSPDPTGKQPQRKYRLGSSRATAGYRKSKHVRIRYAGRNFPIRSLSRPKRRVLSSVPAAREENT